MKTKKYIFWIRSDRGTDSQQVVSLDSKAKRHEIKDRLELWCDSFGAWNASENVVKYGFTTANKTTLKQLGTYNNFRAQRGQQVERLIKNAITSEDYQEWLKKNKKAMRFPFK
jgi:hypothetical protein